MFKDRIDAGQKLSQQLQQFGLNQNAIVVGLARGGVVVAAAIAKALHLPLDIIVVRKLGAPQNPELAIGAIAEESVYLDKEIIQSLNIFEQYIQEIIEKEKKIAIDRSKKYRHLKEKLNLKDKIVILVDDGIATGSTMKASIIAIQRQKPRKIIIAVPIAPIETIEKLKKEVDQCICLYSPDNFMAVGQFYELFPQVEDSEITFLLEKS